MSVFDNHLDPKQLQAESDKMILKNYKISNSGSTLIPREGSFALTPRQKKLFWGAKKTTKIPTGTFKEEHSIFRSMYGDVPGMDTYHLYPVFEETIRGLELPCLVYNQKRYYQVNRDVKKKISTILYKRFGKYAHGC
jgi:hypothetical protein